MRTSICTCLCTLLAVVGSAQDIHFSQFMNSPMNLNPALAGAFDCDYRFVANYRTQWRSVTVPYVTYGISADAKDLLKVNGLGAGLSIYNDQAGDSKFSTLQINLAAAYHMYINSDSTMMLGAGLQSGFTQRTIDYNALTFDNQYNGFAYQPTLPNNETFQRNGRGYANMNAGINWRYNIKPRNNVQVGMSLLNISKPKQSFFNVDNIKLDRRFNAHISGQVMITKEIDLHPSILIMGQGTYREYTLGTSLKYILNSGSGGAKYTALYGGIWTRAADAAYIMVGMDYDSWHAGVTYDINYSGLTPASNYRGGLEFSLIYKICNANLPPRVRFKICPDYI